MEDSAVDPRTGQGAETMGVSYELVPARAGGGVALKVSLDKAWLDDPARVYPVRVDPSYWNSTTLQDDTYVMSGFTRDNAYDAELKVGTYNGGANVARSYMNFDVAGLAGKVINSATFQAYETWSWSCEPRGIGLYRVTQGWGGHSMTGWPGATYGEQVAWSSFAMGYGGGCPAGWASFNVTNTVQNWTSGFTGKFGLMMKVDSEGDNLAWKKFASWDYSGGGWATPRIDIYWSEPSYNREPFGSIDDAYGQPGRVYLRGWGIDPEVVSPIDVHVYIDGAFADAFTANTYRPDVGAAYPGYGNYHGYERSISRAAGWRNVCVYLINVPSGNNPQLGCRWVYVSPPTPPSTPTSVAATANPNGSATISWVRSTNDGGAAIDFYAINTFYSSNGAYTGQQNIVCGSCSTTTFSGLSGGTGYYFAVYPHNVAGYGTPGWSNTITTTSLPGSPTTATATANLDSSVSVNWSLVSNNGGTAIDWYAINAYYASNGSYAGRQNLVCATCASTVFTGLQQGSAYYFGVFAHNAVGYGSPKWTNTVTVATFVNITGPPTNVVATRGDTVASVSWTPPVLAVPPLTTYTVRAYRASDNVNVSSTSAGSSTSTTVSGLKNGTAYYFKVTATNIGTSPESAPSNAITPAGVPFQPTAATAVRGDSKATVSWSPPPARPDGTPGDNGATITSYTVTASPGGATATSASTTTAEVTGLSNGVSYTFAVAATNAVGVGPASSASSGVIPAGAPLAPTNLLATAGDRRATVTWEAASPNGSAVTGYTVTAAPGGASTTVSGSTSTATVNGLTAGTSYTFTVIATNAAGPSVPSTPSNTVVILGPPSRPTGVAATVGTAQATITWSPSSPNGAAVTGYTVTAAPGGASTTVSGSTSTATVTGLTAGTSYTFTVVATNTFGDSAPSLPSNAVTTPGAPNAPMNVMATGGNGQATVGWSPSSENGSPITQYVVTASPGDATATVAGSATSATVAGLVNGTRYTFAVRATNAVGTSSASSASNDVWPLAGASDGSFDQSRIDLYFFISPDDNPAPIPCIRIIRDDGQAAYTCRRLSPADVIVAAVDVNYVRYVERGEASGGGNYTAYVNESVYEGCRYLEASMQWNCASTFPTPYFKVAATDISGSFTALIVKKWALNQATVALCVNGIYTAVFQTRDGSDIVNNCA